MSKCFEEEQANASIFKKLFWNIRDFFMRIVLKHKERKHKKEIARLSKKDKETIILNTIRIDKGDFSIVINLERYFQSSTLIDDSCCIDNSNINYKVYYFIQYDELKTQDHNEQIFYKLDEAETCFKKQVSIIKKENIETIYDNAMEQMNNKIKELNERIKFFEKKL